jgi:undecaprenyl-diphosphatase
VKNLRALAFLALGAGCLWAFIELADEVIEGATHEIDRRILLALRVTSDLSDPIGPPWLEEMVRDFSALGGTGVLVLTTLTVAGFLVLANLPRAALAMLIAIGSGVIVSMLLKAGFDRPRPELVAHGAIVSSASFPSGHSMMSAVVYLTLGSLLTRVVSGARLRIYIIATAVLLTLLVGASRVYLGVHWPTDVLAGWLVGALWALVAAVVMLRLQLQHTVEEPDDAKRA